MIEDNLKSHDDDGVRPTLCEHDLDLLFRGARTRNAWLPRSVDDQLIRDLYALTRMGPTSMNCCPARFVFVRSEAAKARLKPHLREGNVAKTMSAPCCVIVAYDTRFYELLPTLFPVRDMRSMFEGNARLAEETAKRNAVLQGAYLIMAARALGLDAGPLSGFNADSLSAEFFPDGRWKADFLCNIGYGSEAGIYPRNPRLAFEEACLEL